MIRMHSRVVSEVDMGTHKLTVWMGTTVNWSVSVALFNSPVVLYADRGDLLAEGELFRIAGPDAEFSKYYDERSAPHSHVPCSLADARELVLGD